MSASEAGARISVRYWAAARDATGTTEEVLPSVATLAQLLAGLGERHGAPLARLLPVCSYLVDGDPVGRRSPADVALAPGAVVEVLPPFAGG